MRHMLVIAVVLAVTVGIAGVLYGGNDDSPGLQLLGVLVVVGAIAVGTKAARRGSRR